MNIELPAEIQRMIEEKVATGGYENAAGVVEQAVRLLYERDRQKKIGLDELRREIQKGIDEIDAGLGIEWTEERLEGLLREAERRHATKNRASA
jgi:antitoxin ParD1/3/4